MASYSSLWRDELEKTDPQLLAALEQVDYEIPIPLKKWKAKEFRRVLEILEIHGLSLADWNRGFIDYMETNTGEQTLSGYLWKSWQELKPMDRHYPRGQIGINYDTMMENLTVGPNDPSRVHMCRKCSKGWADSMKEGHDHEVQ